MKWNWLSVFLLGMILTWIGNTNSYAAEYPPVSQSDDPIIFTEESIYPEEVEDALLDDVLSQQSAKLIHHNDTAYVILSLGLCNSMGHQIYVTRAELKDHQLIVWAHVQRPNPEDFIGWGFTKPIKIISVPNQNQQVQHLTVIFS